MRDNTERKDTGSTDGAACIFSFSVISLAFDQLLHVRHVRFVAGEAEAAEMPASFNGGQYRIVVVGNIRDNMVFLVVRDDQRQHVAASLIGRRIAAAAVIAEALE